MATDSRTRSWSGRCSTRDNAYFVPAMSVTGCVWKTHHPSNTAFRGFGGPQGMAVMEDGDRQGRAVPRHGSGRGPRTNFYGTETRNVTHYGQTVEREQAPRHRSSGSRAPRTMPRGGSRRTAVQCMAGVPETRARADAGEVRHLLHHDIPEPGGRARARVRRRDRPRQPWRHGNGTGAPHEDPADRRDGIRRRS